MSAPTGSKKIGLFLLLALLCGGCSHHPVALSSDSKDDTSTPAPRVQVTTVRVGDIAQMLPVTGTLGAPRDREATVSPPAAGTLDLLPVHFGQTVRRGQVIAHLSTLPLSGQIQQARAAIAQSQLQVNQAQTGYVQQKAQTRGAIQQGRTALLAALATEKGTEATLAGNDAAVRNARQTLSRQESLLADGLIAKKDLEAADLAVRSAEAQSAAQREVVAAQRAAVAGQREALAAARDGVLQDEVKRSEIRVAQEQLLSAQGALATLRNQAGLYEIRAPITGVITSLGASEGETVDPTSKLMVISDLDTMELQAAVPAESAQRVHPGQEIQFGTENLSGKNFTTHVRTVSEQVDPVNDTIRVIALVPNPGHRMKDDVHIRADIITGRHRAGLLVPKSAVLFDAAGKATVIVVDSDQKVHTTDVKTGLSEGDTMEITDGLHAGDRIATMGSYGLPDGTKIEIDSGEKPVPATDGKDKESP